MKRNVFMLMLVFVLAAIPIHGTAQENKSNNDAEQTGFETIRGDDDQNVSTSGDLKELVEYFKEEGEIENDAIARSLKLHLTAVEHFEKQEATEKVIKHLNGFNSLLDFQQESGTISERAYQTLKKNTEVLIQQWDSVPIVRDKQSQAVVLITEDANEQTNKAADELVEYVQKSTGTTLSILTSEDGLGDQTRIYIGDSAIEKKSQLEEELSGLDGDGFVIHTEDNHIFIVGPTSWGTEFGTYEFLERYIGVRWLMPGPDGEDVPKHMDISVPRETIIEEAGFYVT